MAISVTHSVKGSDNGTITVGDLREFIRAIDHLGADAKVKSTKARSLLGGDTPYAGILSVEAPLAVLIESDSTEASIQPTGPNGEVVAEDAE